MSTEHELQSGNLAIIGGTGFEILPEDIFAEQIPVETRFGVVPLLSVSYNYVEPRKLFFLSRHGATHGFAPHQIPYHANIAALVAAGVEAVFATNAVGSLRPDYRPGDLVLFDDFIDCTHSRPRTYFVEGGAWSHTDFSVPYDPRLREAICRSASEYGVALHPHGTYLCTDGPRFESPAEVRLFASWGADIVGMTGLPEVVFAREAGLRYAGLGIVTNLAAGLSPDPVSHAEVNDVMAANINLVRELLLRACAILCLPQAL